MNSNILDYMYEGYGYDTDNPLLYVDVENYDETLSENGKMTTRGMETLAYNDGPIGHDPAIPTDKDNEYKELDAMKEDDGIEGLILGCTELPLILSSDNCPVKCFDSVEVHLKKLIKLAME